MPGLTDFFALLREREIGFVLATNNASRTNDHYVKRLAGYGIALSPDEVITSAQATADYLAEQSTPGTPVYYIGEEGLGKALQSAGFRLVGDDETPKYVVVGWDRQLTYAKLAQATVYMVWVANQQIVKVICFEGMLEVANQFDPSQYVNLTSGFSIDIAKNLSPATPALLTEDQLRELQQNLGN